MLGADRCGHETSIVHGRLQVVCRRELLKIAGALLPGRAALRSRRWACGRTGAAILPRSSPVARRARPRSFDSTIAISPRIRHGSRSSFAPRPMFATSQVVRVIAGARLDVPSLKALLAAPFDNALIIEAGNLRPDSGLRKVFETNRSAAALPCYGDERTLAALIDAELAEAGLHIDRETRTYLMTRLGADQALSRSEVTKLALYAKGAREVTPEDIEAIVGDAAETALETFVYAASGGDPAEALREMQRLAAVRHRESVGADRARPALHAVAQGSSGASPRRKRRSGDQVASPAPALQARERCSWRIAAASVPTRLAHLLPLDPGNDQPVETFARARGRACRAASVRHSPPGFDGRHRRCFYARLEETEGRPWTSAAISLSFATSSSCCSRSAPSGVAGSCSHLDARAISIST